eukprot:298160_1
MSDSETKSDTVWYSLSNPNVSRCLRGLHSGLISVTWLFKCITERIASQNSEVSMNRGVPQLKRLVIRFCDWGGSSTGVRDFISKELVDLAKSKQHVEFVTEIRRNRHPFIRGEYVEGRSRTIGVKNQQPAALYKVVQGLLDTTGRPVERLSKPIVSRLHSIQGIWDPEVEYATMKTEILK